jgi:hypothetical protein
LGAVVVGEVVAEILHCVGIFREDENGAALGGEGADSVEEVIAFGVGGAQGAELGEQAANIRGFLTRLFWAGGQARRYGTWVHIGRHVGIGQSGGRVCRLDVAGTRLLAHHALQAVKPSYQAALQRAR